MSEVPISAQERAAKLREAIHKYRELYHVYDREEISPEALDSLKRELSELELKYPELITPDSPTQRVAGKAIDVFKKVPHKIPQWSLSDAFTEEDIRAFDARVRKGLAAASNNDSVEYVVELKIDGLKIVLEYVDGALTVAATRGDGVVGEDVTHNVRTIESVPLLLKTASSLTVEGEVWLGEKELARINDLRSTRGEPLFANPRNAAAGSLRQLDPRIAAERKLDVFIYDLAAYDQEMPETQAEELELLKKLGFKTNPHWKICKTIDDVIDFWKKWQNKARSQDYWIDGAVVKVASRAQQEVLGYTGKGPRWAIAFKFPTEQATTTIEDITLQVGRTGIITPVAELIPVSLLGTVVSRATLHNEDEIKRLDIRIGDTVVVQKAGDVIPDIVSVVKELRPRNSRPYHFPSHIEGIGDIERIPGEAAYRAKNPRNVTQQVRRIAYFTSKKGFNMVGLGPKVIEQLFSESLVAHPSDLFSLTVGDLLVLERFGQKKAENIIQSIHERTEVTLARFITALGMPHVGEETAYELATHFDSWESFAAASVESLQSISGVGDIVAREIVTWLSEKENAHEVEKILRHVHVHTESDKGSAQKGVFAGKSFVLTGTLARYSRDEAKALIRERGGDPSESVSSKTDYVIMGENPGSKVAKAQKLGVAILTEDDFISLLAQ